jgi:tetratricopeptide (TPR) repeat protein
MQTQPYQNIKTKILSVFFILGLLTFAQAKEPSAESLTEVQKQARVYRQQGLAYQSVGDADSAMTLYQKAVETDPGYAVAYNDLGIIYEAKGLAGRAEGAYLKAVKCDESLIGAYTNLALFYENKRDLKKAAYYWEKRANLGSPDDPWTQKAKARLKDINFVLSDSPVEDIEEQEVVVMLNDVAKQKALLKKDDLAFAKVTFDKARQSYKLGDEASAFKLALDAKQLDPSNDEIEEFIRKVQNRLLSR